MREEERKFDVPEGFLLPDLSNEQLELAGLVPGPELSLRATYYDTADLRLIRAGVTLRHRTGEGEPVWTLKLPVFGAGPEVREELSVPGEPGRVPAELADLTRVFRRSMPLRRIAVIETQRSTHQVKDVTGEMVAELVDDMVTVRQGRSVTGTFREVELERRGLSDDAFDWTTSALLTSGAERPPFLAKLARALGEQAVAPSDFAEPKPPTKSSPAADLVAFSLQTGLQRLVLAGLGVRRDAPDAVHQLRVSCRRLRSDLRTFGSLVEKEWADGLRFELQWLASNCGAARDLEVLRTRLRGLADIDPEFPIGAEQLDRIDALFAARETAAITDVKATLNNRRYLALLDALVDAARSPRTTPAAKAPCGEALPPLVHTSWTRFDKAAGRLRTGDPDAAWHLARIRAKRARYAAEAVAPVLGKYPHLLAGAAHKAQDLLGEHQDASVAAQELQTLAAGTTGEPLVAFAAGRLAEQQRESRHATRREFRRVWPRLSGSTKIRRASQSLKPRR